jgi:hypothetical protein
MDVLELAPFYLWSYNGHVEIVNFPNQAYNQIGGSGQCPHCQRESYFRPVVEHIWSHSAIRG